MVVVCAEVTNRDILIVARSLVAAAEELLVVAAGEVLSCDLSANAYDGRIVHKPYILNEQ